MWFLKKRKRKNHLEGGKESTFCMLPWVHIHALPNGNVLPCCVSPYDEPVSTLSKYSLKNAWNSTKMKELRVNMINGEKSKSCRRCYEIETFDGISMRKQMNTIFQDDYPLVSKTKKDGTVKSFKMLYLDIRFSNICNLKCMGCSPALSSKWADDYRKIYNKDLKDKDIISISDKSEHFMKELIAYLPDAKRVYFAGGEPLLMDEHYQCLEYFLNNEKSDVLITYNTNLMTLKFKNKNVLEYWDKFKHVCLSVSIDDIFERGEYFRFGTKWNVLISNVETVKSICPHIKIDVTCTVSLFNVGRLGEIHRYLYTNDYIDENGFFLNYLLDPAYLRSQNLPDSQKVVITNQLNDYIVEVKTKYPDKNWSQLEESIRKQIECLHFDRNIKDVNNFKSWINKIDKVRSNSVFVAYPEIANLMEIE
jgi:MoaA/NifB/PqqE/SkfB family radical SAM enzyme